MKCVTVFCRSLYYCIFKNSCVGELGVGELGVGELVVGELGVGELAVGEQSAAAL